jgi:2'-5' RNA ligase
VIRAFLAIDLGEEIRDRYGRSYALEGARPRRLRWVRPENVHLTLRFLGDVPEDRLDPLRDRIATVTGRTAAFRATLGKAGCFGPCGAPRVLWFSVGEGEVPLGDLTEAIEGAVSTLGFEGEDRPWTAHLTVARNPDRVAWEGWERELESWGLAGMVFDVREVVLFSSELRPQGPTYRRVWSLPLAGNVSEVKA